MKPVHAAMQELAAASRDEPIPLEALERALAPTGIMVDGELYIMGDAAACDESARRLRALIPTKANT
jgi:hypothetical protein